MASLIEAIDIKRKMYFEYENAPYHCLDVEVSKPTARGGQTLVRLKMRNLLTRAVFDKTFKAGEKFKEPDLVIEAATYLYSDGDGFHFMDQQTFDDIMLTDELIGQDQLKYLKEGMECEGLVHNDRVITVELPSFVELTVTRTAPGVRGDTATGGTKPATLETGATVQVPLFIEEGQVIRVDRREDKYLTRV